MSELSELQRITEGLNLLRAHGLTLAHTYQGGLFVIVPAAVLSLQLAREMKSLGWLWHQHRHDRAGYLYQLSPL